MKLNYFQLKKGPESGNSGVVKLVTDENYRNDIDYITSYGPDPPYMAVIFSRQFNL